MALVFTDQMERVFFGLIVVMLENHRQHRHGYRPIGFIKNYAPHMQPEQMTKLSEALHALGVSPDLVKAFDASLKRLGIGEDVSSLPVEIAGRTGDFKPGKKWNPHYLTRTGERTEFDALA